MYHGPFDSYVVDKEKEKVDKYQDLKCELKRIWSCSKVMVIPIVKGALGTNSKNSTIGLLRPAVI